MGNDKNSIKDNTSINKDTSASSVAANSFSAYQSLSVEDFRDAVAAEFEQWVHRDRGLAIIPDRILENVWLLFDCCLILVVNTTKSFVSMIWKLMKQAQFGRLAKEI
uniref:Uncharacterized protein n=1 Tax=Macrostomum lignano TaxID=282301 RepID=A0A1I8J830_9PLAT